jgi:hypothetical protein
LNRNSERNPRPVEAVLRGLRANYRLIKIPYGEDSLQLAAGNLQYFAEFNTRWLGFLQQLFDE